MQRLLAALTRDWALKLTALVLAFLLWTVTKAESVQRVTIRDVPVRVVNRDASWVLTAPPAPSTVDIEVVGPTREILRLAVERPEVVMPVDEVTDSSELRVLRTGWVQLYGGMDNTRVDDIRPSTVRLHYDRVRSRLVPVSVRIIGAPADGFRLDGGIRVDPQLVRVSGASSRLAELDTLRLGPIDLSGWTATDSFAVGVDTAGLGVLVAPRQVQVVVPIEPVDSSLARDTTRAARPR